MTLIHSVLDALPTYMLSVVPIPVGVQNRLDKIRKNFLWQGKNDQKGYHLVKWKSVTTCKSLGHQELEGAK